MFYHAYNQGKKEREEKKRCKQRNRKKRERERERENERENVVWESMELKKNDQLSNKKYFN